MHTHIITQHKRFYTFGTNLYAQLLLINKISASELSRKFIKSALLVGSGAVKYYSRYTCVIRMRWEALKVVEEGEGGGEPLPTTKKGG